MLESASSLKERYEAVLDRVSSAALASSRKAEDIRVIVVSKNHPADLVIDLIELGARDFGENRDQEAGPKALEVAEKSSAQIHWHFVGQLQSNKVKSVLKYANTIHSIDRSSLASSIAKEVEILRQSQPNFSVDGFIQLNLTDDPNRGGIQESDLAPFAERILQDNAVNLLGVMGVASLDRDPSRDFETIAKTSERLQRIVPTARFISAGMSEDFEQAIPFGATHLRIGTAITGKRNY
jgi:pyridoxal phosphate enzyme (YggS family)